MTSHSTLRPATASSSAARHAARRRRLHHHALHLADQLHRAERVAVAAVAVPVVDRQRLLERHVVATVDVDGDDVGVVVHHEVAPDLAASGWPGRPGASRPPRRAAGPPSSPRRRRARSGRPVTSHGAARVLGEHADDAAAAGVRDEPARPDAASPAGRAPWRAPGRCRTSPRRSWRRAGRGTRRTSASGCSGRRRAGRRPSRSRPGARPARAAAPPGRRCRARAAPPGTGTACSAAAPVGSSPAVPWTR